MAKMSFGHGDLDPPDADFDQRSDFQELEPDGPAAGLGELRVSEPDVIDPPSKAATTERLSTGVNPNKSALHSVGIGILLETLENRFRKRTFGDSESRCTLQCEKSGLAMTTLVSAALGITEAESP